MIEKKVQWYAADTGVDLDFTVARALDLVGTSEEAVAALGYGVLRHLVEAMAEPAANAPPPPQPNQALFGWLPVSALSAYN